MLTQLDNVLEPLLEQSRRAIGFAPHVDIHYIDKDHVDVYVTGHNVRVRHAYNSLLEGIEKQFDEFISEVQLTIEGERAQHRTVREILNEIEPTWCIEYTGEPVMVDRYL